MLYLRHMLGAGALWRVLARPVRCVGLLGLAGCSLDFHEGARPTAILADAGAGDGGAIAPDCHAPGVLFCADFESGAVDTGWDDRHEEQGGAVSLDTTIGAGSPRSARAAVAAVSSPAYAALVKKLPGEWRPTTIELDVFLAAPAFASESSNIALAHVAFIGDAAAESQANTLYVSLGVETQRVTVSIQSPDFQQLFSDAPFPYDRWVHVALDVDPGAKVAELRLGADTVIHGSFSSTLAAGNRPSPTARVTLGLLGFNAPVPATTVNFDNVVLAVR